MIPSLKFHNARSCGAQLAIVLLNKLACNLVLGTSYPEAQDSTHTIHCSLAYQTSVHILIRGFLPDRIPTYFVHKSYHFSLSDCLEDSLIRALFAVSSPQPAAPEILAMSKTRSDGDEF